MITEIAKLVSKCKRLEAENAEMREFILGARHDAGCNRSYNQNYECDCGLTKLQNELRDKT